jgi:hypothetical protein
LRLILGATIKRAQKYAPVYALAGLHDVHEVAHATAVAGLFFKLEVF